MFAENAPDWICLTSPTWQGARQPEPSNRINRQEKAAPPGYLTLGSAASYLCVTPQRIQYLKKRGHIRAVRIGHFWFYSKDDMDSAH
jgi:hypothetical protein